VIDGCAVMQTEASWHDCERSRVGIHLSTIQPLDRRLPLPAIVL
jgi:hypothetical protein